MTIRLSEELIVNSNKTIDGRGARVTIANGAQITIQNVHNIIIHNIRIKNIKAASGATIRDSPEHFGQRMQSDGDGISVLGSSDIWIDHVSMSNCADGIIDVIDGSTAVTISNSHFAHQNNVRTKLVSAFTPSSLSSITSNGLFLCCLLCFLR